MPDQSPPSVPRSWLVAAAALYALLLAYAAIVLAELLFAVLAGVFLVLCSVLGLFLWRFLLAVESLADAHQRIARARERERD